ncbi:MAG: IclR family transcriptional regulator [Desulfobacterales bacterium]|nr:MAG: IclR family transcriptional regulator [Desulfobacterales bacterium]
MKINSIDRCIKVIETLSENPHGLKLTQLSRKLDLHPSSVHHIVRTLSPYDYIVQDPDTKKYSLGFRFLEISRRIVDNLDIRQVARKHLDKLRKEAQETVHLAVLQGRKVVYIDKIDNPGGLSLATYIGFATDPHAAAGGKVLLAGLPAPNVREIYRNRKLKGYGKKTITTLPLLLDELDKVGKQGYAVDDEEYYEGVRCVAAPVRSGREVVASVSVTGSVFTVTMDRIERELKNLVMAAADKISAELRW